MTDDPDAAAILQAFRIDLARLRRDLVASMEGATDEAAGDASRPAKPSPELQRAVQVAATHALSVRRETVTGVDVLVVLLTEPAGHFLQLQGLTRYDATRFIDHGMRGDPAAAGADLPAGSSAEVRMLNDDYTPMEFVVDIRHGPRHGRPGDAPHSQRGRGHVRDLSGRRGAREDCRDACGGA